MSGDGVETVLVSGIFNVLHPGHVRLLRFAKSLGTHLIVAVLADDLSSGAATVPESQRLEAIESLRVVDSSFIVRDSVNDAITRLRPDVVVKGREHRATMNPEEEALGQYGGRLVFSSGDSFFSVTDLMADDRTEARRTSVDLPTEFMEHHNISRARMASIVEEMRHLKVLVVGDIIVDEYISCHPLGMSREDPTIVVTPIETRRFIGGAAIVAGHAGRLGRAATIHSVGGDDEQADFVRSALTDLGVSHVVHDDVGRPTTTKQRYRAAGKTLFRVSHLRQDAISETLQEMLYAGIERDLPGHHLLIFSDFNYGVLPQPLVDRLSSLGRSLGVTMAADSQTSSQVGDVSRFTGMDVLTPTEYEARVALRNFDDGLVLLADQLRQKASAQVVLMTLAEDGIFIRGASGASSASTDRLPALNGNPVDVAGAGDSLLVVSSMALACGASFTEAALLGSVAAALQIAVTGNRPLSPDQILEAIGR